MPAERPWLRLYSETIHDRKIRRLKPEHRWLWTALLCMAGASKTRGEIRVGCSPATLDDIADEAALTRKSVAAGLAHLEELGMLERRQSAWVVVNWAGRQYDSDTSTDRVRAFRQRRGNVPRNGNGAPPESETETESNSSPNGIHDAPGDDDEDERFPAVVESRIAKRMHGRHVTNPKAYRATIVAELIPEGDRTRRLLARYPDAPAATIAGYLDGEASTLAAYRRSAPDGEPAIAHFPGLEAHA